jgi:uncharacterized membrane protein
MIADLHLRAIGIGRPDDTQSGGHHGVALRRLALSAAIGITSLAGALLAGGSWAVAVALGWVAAALVFMLSVWIVVFSMDARATRRAARLEDTSRAAADMVLLCAAVASLVSVGFVLAAAADRTGAARAALIGLAVGAVTAAWASVHTVFALRYARLYYADPVGGIDFHVDDLPDYRDLAYVSLTIGMTFQVSDTDLTAKEIRRTALKHALLSYLFGAVIVAITINIVGSLTQ